eukprot:1305807-Lingulodinium_polyedra.AAC.1
MAARGRGRCRSGGGAPRGALWTLLIGPPTARQGGRPVPQEEAITEPDDVDLDFRGSLGPCRAHGCLARD